jgi:hypothetical protein
MQMHLPLSTGVHFKITNSSLAMFELKKQCPSCGYESVDMYIFKPYRPLRCGNCHVSLKCKNSNFFNVLYVLFVFFLGGMFFVDKSTKNLIESLDWYVLLLASLVIGIWVYLIAIWTCKLQVTR